MENNLYGGPEYLDKGNLLGIFRHSGLVSW
jgi:hypothetical protein